MEGFFRGRSAKLPEDLNDPSPNPKKDSKRVSFEDFLRQKVSFFICYKINPLILFQTFESDKENSPKHMDHLKLDSPTQLPKRRKKQTIPIYDYE